MDDGSEIYLRVYGGKNYAEPRTLILDSIGFEDHWLIDDLIQALSDFRQKHAGCTIKAIERDSIYASGYRAERLESPAEVEKRVAALRKQFDQIPKEGVERRRAEYYRLKREFGDL